MIKNRRAFIIGIKSTILSKKEKLFLRKYQPWGVILFSRNLKKFNQIVRLTTDIRLIFKDDKYPILIDQEGGKHYQIKGPLFFGSAQNFQYLFNLIT